MCARYTLRANAGTLMELFWIQQLPDMEEQVNISPTQEVLTVDSSGFVFRRWGLVPSFSKGPNTGPIMINARSESAHERPTFRRLLKDNRCLIPADGFYEWETTGRQKTPWIFEFVNQEVFCFAGLYDTWQELESCTLFTCEPNDLVRPLHDRMPVIVPIDRFDEYLDPNVPIESFFSPIPAESMTKRVQDPRTGKSVPPPQVSDDQPGLFT